MSMSGFKITCCSIVKAPAYVLKGVVEMAGICFKNVIPEISIKRKSDKIPLWIDQNYIIQVTTICYQ